MVTAGSSGSTSESRRSALERSDTFERAKAAPRAAGNNGCRDRPARRARGIGGRWRGVRTCRGGSPLAGDLRRAWALAVPALRASRRRAAAGKRTAGRSVEHGSRSLRECRDLLRRAGSHRPVESGSPQPFPRDARRDRVRQHHARQSRRARGDDGLGVGVLDLWHARVGRARPGAARPLGRGWRAAHALPEGRRPRRGLHVPRRDRLAQLVR